MALPLDAINEAAAKEKKMRHGNPANLHRWWARRPLAAARAVVFSQLVNDPGYQQGGGFKYGKNKREAEKERKRLFQLMEDLVAWDNNNNEAVLTEARNAILQSWRETCDLNKNHPKASEWFNRDSLPPLHDPFAGGGAIPLEAQRLGLTSHATDLNPVAVLINKAMVELPRLFADVAPVNPQTRKNNLLERSWNGLEGLAEDIRYYSDWVRKEATRRIGHLYPPVTITDEMASDSPILKDHVGKSFPVLAWIWTRTVKSSNPAFSHVHVPLASSFVLARRKGKEAHVQPVITGDEYRFTINHGKIPTEATVGTKIGRGCKFKCLLSDTPIPDKYIKAEAVAGRLGARLMAIVAEGPNGRIYLPPVPEHEDTARQIDAEAAATSINVAIAEEPRAMWCLLYGVNHFDQLYTRRQLVALSELSDLIKEARATILADAEAAGHRLDSTAVADAITVYLSLILSKAADSNNAHCPWEPTAQCSRQLYGRQGIPMVWDYAEANPLHDSSGGFVTNTEVSVRSLRCFPNSSAVFPGEAHQANASLPGLTAGAIVSTDPPYYDNIGYADYSDFFYVWLRRSLREVLPELFATMAVPKSEELVAAPHRQGGREEAEKFFLDGMTTVLTQLAKDSHPAFPITFYYAFKQSETQQSGTSSTGWETFLEAILKSGLAIYGTWPMRTESTAALKHGSNSLASSVVLVCKRRDVLATAISCREFIRELNKVLPEALDEMTRGIGSDQSPVAPVDLSQAIIGPGMAVFSKYSAVLEADGSPMTVRTALQLINRFLAEDDFDKDTQFCLHWFEENGWKEGEFGQADVLARAKATSVGALTEAGVIKGGSGKVRLLKWSEYPSDWNPAKDSRTPVWESLHHLIRGLKQGGESAAGQILAGVQSQAEAARQLAYRLYTLCERKGWAEDAGAYNELITSWSGIETATPRIEQRELF